ncbi:MAG: metallophosphoesterase [Deltaproteobacteria bacterium]
MRVLIASDLHFEFHADSGTALLDSLPEADVLVCPGDLSIAPLLGDALGKLLERYAHVVFVAGNHEFYRSSLLQVRQALRRVAECIDGFHYLEQSECTIEGRRFLGATLWFPRKFGIELLQPLASDFRLISDAVPGIYEEHQRAVSYLDATVNRDTIVVTHHLPHARSLPPSLLHSPLNRFLLSDLTQLIADKQPALWVHGHAHTSSDYHLGHTRTLCNPFGYSGRSENPGFRRDCLIDL